MPQQEFRFSYLIHPDNYEHEVLGTSVPFTFVDTGRDVYAFGFSAVAAYDILKMNDVRLAHRIQFSQDARMDSGDMAEKSKTHDATLSILIQSEQDIKEASLSFALHDAEMLRNYRAASIEDVVLLFSKHSINKGDTLSLSLIAARPNINKESLMLDGLALSEMVKKYRDGDVLEERPIAERPNFSKEIYEMMNVRLANRHNAIKDILFMRGLILSDRSYKNSGLIREIVQGDRGPRLESKIYQQLLFSDKTYRDGLIEDTVLLQERIIYELDMTPTPLEAVVPIRIGKLIKDMVYSERPRKSSRIIRKEYYMERDGRASVIYNRTLFMERNSRAGRFTGLSKDNTVFASRDPSGALVIRKEYKFERSGYNSRIITKQIMALIDGKAARLKDDSVYADDDASFDAIFYDDFILSEYGSIDTFIFQAMKQFEKHGVEVEIAKAIFADNKDSKTSVIIDGIDVPFVKSEHNSEENLLINATFEKDEKDSEWIERVIYAAHVGNEVFMHELLQNANRLTKDTILSVLELAEVPDREGLRKQLELKLAWNKDKPNRPAGLLEVKDAIWDMGWEDLELVWDPGWDYMDPPSKDYPYEKHVSSIYDESTGVPFSTLYPTNSADVQIESPIAHPIPSWSDVGIDEAWVELFIYQDVILHIAILQRREKAKLAGMTGQEALQFILKEVHSELKSHTPWTSDYKRVFRFVRWYAEKIAHSDSITILHRKYNDWTDGIIGTGNIDAISTKSMMTLATNGLIESNSVSGYFEFEKEGYIDGDITFSQVIQSTNPLSISNLRFYIDGVLTQTFMVASGVQRLSFDVPQGNHMYRFEYDAEVGDTVKISGINISGVKFTGATTSQKDKGALRGLAAINHLIQASLSYYHKHHKDKVKGAMKLKQRKIWLS